MQIQQDTNESAIFIRNQKLIALFSSRHCSISGYLSKRLIPADAYGFGSSKLLFEQYQDGISVKFETTYDANGNLILESTNSRMKQPTNVIIKTEYPFDDCRCYFWI
jgi:hypothetical protein